MELQPNILGNDRLMLHTPRSPLIPFDRNDAPLFHAINTDPFVRKYLWDDEVISLRKAEEMIETNHRNFREQGFGLWKIFTMYPMK